MLDFLARIFLESCLGRAKLMDPAEMRDEEKSQRNIEPQMWQFAIMKMASDRSKSRIYVLLFPRGIT